MPKMKTKGAAKKRLKLTGSGRIKRAIANHSHILTKKSANRKRKLRQTSMVSETDLPRMKKLLQGH